MALTGGGELSVDETQQQKETLPDPWTDPNWMDPTTLKYMELRFRDTTEADAQRLYLAAIERDLITEKDRGDALIPFKLTKRGEEMLRTAQLYPVEPLVEANQVYQPHPMETIVARALRELDPHGGDIFQLLTEFFRALGAQENREQPYWTDVRWKEISKVAYFYFIVPSVVLTCSCLKAAKVIWINRNATFDGLRFCAIGEYVREQPLVDFTDSQIRIDAHLKEWRRKSAAMKIAARS